MERQEIIDTFKSHYTRDLRKQLVKTLLKNEKETKKPDYKMINQMFLFVQKELHWKIPENPSAWDYTPLEIMEDIFPNIESTKWYELQVSTAKKMIDALEKSKEHKHA